MMPASEVIGYSLLGAAYAMTAAVTVLITPNRAGIWNIIFYKIVVPVFWLVALVVVVATQNRRDYIQEVK